MKEVQVEKEVSFKLDKVVKLLDEILQAIDKENLDISPTLYRKLVARWKAIEGGRVKLHHYRNLAEFEKAIS